MELELFGKKYVLTVDSNKGPRSDNQDSVSWTHYGNGMTEGSMEIQSHHRPETFVAVVCDGMGGLENGSKISNVVCNRFIRDMAKEHYGTLDEFIDKVPLVLNAIEDTVRNELPNSGTTMVATVAVDDKWCLMHLGDSRAYHKRFEWKRTLDHSPVESLLSNGLIDDEEALYHPMRNIVSKYIGGGYAKEIEIELIEPDEEIILCSDGAFGYMAHNEFIGLITRNKNAVNIVQAAISNGGKDNTTVLCLTPIDYVTGE